MNQLQLVSSEDLSYIIPALVHNPGLLGLESLNILAVITAG